MKLDQGGSATNGATLYSSQAKTLILCQISENTRHKVDNPYFCNKKKQEKNNYSLFMKTLTRVFHVIQHETRFKALMNYKVDSWPIMKALKQIKDIVQDMPGVCHLLYYILSFIFFLQKSTEKTKIQKIEFTIGSLALGSNFD